MNKTHRFPSLGIVLAVNLTWFHTIAADWNPATTLEMTADRATAIQTSNLVVFSIPEAEKLSDDYVVKVNGNLVDVQTARVNDPPNNMLDYGGTYSFINFDFKGTAQIDIWSKRTLEMLQVRPHSNQAKEHIVSEHQAALMLDHPCILAFEPEGKRRPLLIFANPMEANVPAEHDPNVLYFGPGVYRPEGGIINLKSGQTLYLAGGAVVHAAVNATNAHDISVRGRGILDGSSWEHKKGPQRFFVEFTESTNVTVEGIIIRGSYLWTLVTKGCEHVMVDNVKICGGRVVNDDGIDPCNTRDMTIRNGFIRSDDDCLAFKGLREEWGDVDNIRVQNMVLWNDRSMIARFGVESTLKRMQNLVFTNIDIIHYGRQTFNFEPLDDTILQNVLIEDVRIHGDGQRLLLAIMPILHPYRLNTVAGHVRNIHFKNMKLTGAWGDYGYPERSAKAGAEYGGSSHPYFIEVGCYDDEHSCEGIVFEDVTILGRKLTRDAPRLHVGQCSTVTVE